MIRPIQRAEEANVLIARLVTEKQKQVTWPLSVDPLIKPSNMRAFISGMYCDDPNNLQRSPFCLTWEDTLTMQGWEKYVEAEFELAYNRLLSYVEGRPTPVCSVHSLIYDHRDDAVYCGRCNKQWVLLEGGKLIA